MAALSPERTRKFVCLERQDGLVQVPLHSPLRPLARQGLRCPQSWHASKLAVEDASQPAPKSS